LRCVCIGNEDAEREYKAEEMPKMEIWFNGDYDDVTAYFFSASFASCSAR